MPVRLLADQNITSGTVYNSQTEVQVWQWSTFFWSAAMLPHASRMLGCQRSNSRSSI